MFNYDVLTKSYEAWHIRQLSSQMRKDYVTGLHYLVSQLGERQKQLNTFYGNLLDVQVEEDASDIQSTLNQLNKFRFKWKGTQSYCYRLIDELALHTLSMFPEKKETLRTLLKSIGMDAEQIDILLNNPTHAKETDKQLFKYSRYRKTLEFWVSPHEKKEQQLGATLILGTMSAGKSTILNNLLGEDWAKTQNQVSTNFSLRYQYCPTLKYTFLSDEHHQIFPATGSISDWIEQLNESRTLDSDQLTFWSGQSAKELADYRYTIVDTPGMNSSWKKEHYYETEKTLREHSYDKVIVVLNVTQLGTNDEKELVHLVKTHSKSSLVLFVLNKIDELDVDLGETVEHHLQVAKVFLEENGVQNPNIIATSAVATRLLNRDVISLTKRERKQREYFQSYFRVEEPSVQSTIHERTGFSHIINFMKSE